MATVARRFALWLAICAFSAAPSFALARNASADPLGMIAAVLLFAVAYTLVTCTERFARFHRRPFVRETLYVGYGLRLTLSAVGLFAIATDFRAPHSIAVIPDVAGGLLSLRIVGIVSGDASAGAAVTQSFAGAFALTCVQGAILNVMVFFVMAAAYGLQRAFRTLPPEAQRGFDVVPVAEAVTPSAAREAAR